MQTISIQPGPELSGTCETTVFGMKSFTMLLAVSCICLIGNVSCSAEASLPELPYSQKLQEAIYQVVSVYSEHEFGISAAIIVPGFSPWTGVSGYSHSNVPIAKDMLFDVGSIQKNFEAALVLELAEDELLSLDDPISKYLPVYPHVDKNITIRQLLDHTSGVFNVFEHPDFPWLGTDIDYSKRWTDEQVFEHFVLEPYGPPGYAQRYSSTNYLLLTGIIEQVTGSGVPDGIRRYFLEPMNLEHTFVSMGEQPPSTYAVAHPWVDIDLDGTLEDLYGIPRTWIATLTHPVMFSTAGDLAQWMAALYHQENVLSSSSLAEMLSIPENVLQDPDGGRYGLGVADYTDLLGVHAIGHTGSSPGYSAAALYLPEDGIVAVWLINTGESPYQLAGQMMGHAWSSITDVLTISWR